MVCSLILECQSERFEFAQINYNQFSVNKFFGRKSAAILSLTKEQHLDAVDLEKQVMNTNNKFNIAASKDPRPT